MNSSTEFTHAEVAGRPVAALKLARIAAGLPRRLAAGALIAAMVVGAVAVWTVVPAACLMIASELADSHTLLVLTVFAGIPAAMAIVGGQLARLERLYQRTIGQRPAARMVPAWRRSYSDSRPTGRSSVLEAVMVMSVVVAAAAWIAWFLLSAGSPG